MRARVLTLTAGLIIGVAPGTLAATDLPVALQLGYGTKSDLGVGARLSLRLLPNRVGAAGRLTVVTAFDYFFPSEGELGDLGVTSSYLEVNQNLVYGVSRPPKRGLAPYIGAGLNVTRASVGVEEFSQTDINLGLNLLAGVKVHRGGGFVLFGELRHERGGGRQTVLTAGVFF